MATPAPDTRPAQANARTIFDIGFGDYNWTWEPDATTPMDGAELRVATGLGMSDVFAGIQAAARRRKRLDIDIAGAVVFLARRQVTPGISFEDATSALTYGSVIRYGVHPAGDGTEDDSPEA